MYVGLSYSWLISLEMVLNVQHWYKDEKYSTRVKDADGHPCFALVNKATGEAMKHSVGATHPVSISSLNGHYFQCDLSTGPDNSWP